MNVDSSVTSAATTSTATSTDSGGSLGSNAFMQLLLVQLQYQDPTEPMSSTDIVTQLSNLTMVASSAETQASVDALSEQMYQSQSLYASSLVGQQVIALANVFTVEEGDLPVEGQVMLSSPCDDLALNIYNDSDELVATLEMGPQTEAGQVDFDLADLDEPLPPGDYCFEAIMTTGESTTEVAVAQRSTVTSVVIPGAGQEILVDIDGIGLVPLSYLLEVEGPAPDMPSVTNPEDAMMAPVGANPFFIPPANMKAAFDFTSVSELSSRSLPPGAAALALAGRR